MQPSLREALSQAVQDPMPSTVDIEAALRTGYRRRARRITALAGVGTFVVAAAVVASTTLTFSQSAPPGRPTPSHTPQPTTVSTSPPKMIWPCGEPDPHLVDTARQILPPAGTWSEPMLFGSCARLVPAPDGPKGGPPPSRTSGVKVTMGGETGSITLDVNHNPGSHMQEPCEGATEQIAYGTQTCRSGPEGILRLDDITTPTSAHILEAMLATKAGDNIVVTLYSCIDDQPPSVVGPCLSNLPYTTEQLRQVAIAIADELK